MDKEYFYALVNNVCKRISKLDTVMRDSVKPSEMCCLTIRFLATGESFRSLHFLFRLSRKFISDAVIMSCVAIFEEMGPVYLRTPKERDEWEKIEKNFYERWNMPNVLGAMDGKRINIVQPLKSGSHFRDYKENDSVILMGVVGPEYEFINADVGMNRRMSDAGNWVQNEFRKAISAEDNPLNIPLPKVLPGRTQPIPHFLVGDDAFALSSYLMKPYAQTGLTEERRIFNYGLSWARRISENAFGILANRWRVFHKNFQLESDKITVVTLAKLTLHKLAEK